MKMIQVAAIYAGRSVTRYFDSDAHVKAWLALQDEQFTLLGIHHGTLTLNADGMFCWQEDNSIRLEQLA